MSTDDDPFAAFAAEMARAANVEAQAGIPLFNNGTPPDAMLASVSTLDEAAEIFLRAEAMAKSARIQKKAAEQFMAALSVNKGLDDMETQAFRVTVTREDQLSFDDEAFLADGGLSPSAIPSWLQFKTRCHLTPTQLKNLTPDQRRALGKHFHVKGEKVSVSVERK